MDHKKTKKQKQNKNKNKQKTHKYNDWATCYWKLSITKTV
jgi:hypothetical protein